MRFSKSKSVVDGGADAGSKGVGLFIHLGASGWHARTVGASDDHAKKLQDAGEFLLPTDGKHSRPERMLQTVLAELSPSLRAQITHCHLLLDSERLVFSDVKANQLQSADPKRVREFGRGLLGSKDVSFGYGDLGEHHQGATRSNGVYSFVDTGLLRDLLAVLDQLAGKLKGIVPIEALLLKEAEQVPDEPYGAILVGAEYTEVMIAHVGIGALTVRHIPIGIATLLRAVAERTGVTPKQVLGALKSGDHLPNIVTLVSTVAMETGASHGEVSLVLANRDALSELEQENRIDEHRLRLQNDLLVQILRKVNAHLDRRALSIQESVLIPLLQKLNDEIAATLEYFQQQRACGLPRRISLFGELQHILNFDAWLNAGLPHAIQECYGRNTLELFDTFVNHSSLVSINLLSGTDGPLVSVGKTQFLYNATHGMMAVPSKANRALAGAVSSTGRKGGGSGGAAGSRRATAKQQKPQESIVSQVTKLFSGKKTEETPSENMEDERNGFFALMLLLCGLLYLGYDQYTGITQNFMKNLAPCLGDFASNQTLREKVQKSTLIAVVTGQENKVLWTEKFLSIGKNISENLWLTDVYLDGVSTGKTPSASAKLVMKGAALPRSEGHVGVIADFVENLKKDTDMFMGDFSDITFGGLTIDTSDAEPVVRFSLEAHYDPTKRLSVPQVSGGDPVRQYQQIMKNHDASIEQAIGSKNH